MASSQEDLHLQAIIMAKAASELVGVVLVGAGARGAYEAGALAELLPVLEAHGRRPKVFVGTSAGAINAVLFASFAHLPAQAAADRVLALWRQVGCQQVIRPVLPSGLAAAARYLAQVAGLSIPLTGVLDATPLQATLDALVDWRQLHATANGAGCWRRWRWHADRAPAPPGILPGIWNCRNKRSARHT